MKPSREQVLAHVIQLLESLDQDWEGRGAVDDNTYLLGGMNWRSIDVIYLANAMQEHYRQSFPFADFFAGIGQREVKDVTIGEWVDFVHGHLDRESSTISSEVMA